MEYPNSAYLREGLLKSGWSDAAASVVTFILDDLKFQEEVEMLRKHRTPEAIIRDKAAFRLLNPPVKSDVPKSNDQAFEAQHRQILDRSRQQQEHEAKLLSDIAEFRKLQEAHSEIIANLRFHCATMGDIQALASSQDDIKASVSESADAVTGAVKLEAEKTAHYLHELKSESEKIRAESRSIKQTQTLSIEEAKRSRRDAWIRFAITTALLIALILLSALRGYSQQANVNPAITIASCGGLTVTAGARTALTTDTTGKLCADVSGSTITVTLVTTGLATSANQINQTVDINLIEGQNVVTSGNGVLAVGGSTSGGLAIQGQLAGGTPVTITSASANPTVDINLIEGQNVVTSGNGVLAVGGSTSGGLAIQGQLAGGTAVTTTWATASPNITISAALPSGVSNIGAVTARFDTANIAVNLTQVDGTTGKAVTTTWATASPNVTVSAALPTGTNSIGSINNNNTPVIIGAQPVAVTGSTSGTPVTISFQTANIAANLAQIAGATTAVGAGTSNTGTQRIAIADPDPCTPGSGYTKAFTTISTAVSAQIVTGATGQFLYVCAVNIGPMGTATNVAVVSGTGTTCATNIAGLFGGTTAANGWNFAANGGITYGNGGATLAKGITGGNICVIISAANQIQGAFTTVLAP